MNRKEIISIIKQKGHCDTCKNHEACPISCCKTKERVDWYDEWIDEQGELTSDYYQYKYMQAVQIFIKEFGKEELLEVLL